ncbi:cytochrome c oxidase subunit II [Lutibaculum baratangense]|nr:cytochrome c oxidase subunit II [Lutibaculum baratangense]
MASLLWLLVWAAGVIWILVLGTAVYATGISRGPVDDRVANVMILAGGVFLPTLVLGGLVTWTVWTMSGLRVPDEQGLRVAVSGEQWWWRVAYEGPDGNPVASANEIRLPAGETVTLELSSPDVIHSFWIPSIAGKMDMIPGRVNELVLEPTKPGIYRGVCAEYCGTSHALMAFSVVVMEPDAFAAWLAEEARPASASSAHEGLALFLENGCGACHAIRGTEADGRVGPDLTHVASRKSLGAGILPVTQAALEEWITHTREVKPDARMPPYDMLPEAEIATIAGYLASLK